MHRTIAFGMTLAAAALLLPGISAQAGMQAAADLLIDIDDGPHVIAPGASKEIAFDLLIRIDNILCIEPGEAVVTFTSHPTGMDATMPNGAIGDVHIDIPAGSYASGVTEAFETAREVTYTVAVDDAAPAEGHVMVYRYTAHFDGETRCRTTSGPGAVDMDFQTRINTGDAMHAMEDMDHDAMTPVVSDAEQAAPAAGVWFLLPMLGVAALAHRLHRDDSGGGVA